MMNNETDTANEIDTKMQMHNHRLTQAQIEAIEHEIKSTQPLASHLLPIDVLLHQYSNTNNDGISTGDNYSCDSSDGSRAVAQHPGYAEAAAFLSTKYKSLRRVRGDGNCYYRAFLYSLCEHLMRSCFIRDNHHAEFTRLKELVNNSLKWVCRHGYEEYTIDTFWEEMMELFDFIGGASTTVPEKVDDGDGSKSETTCNMRLENALQQLHSKLNEENAVSA